MGDESTGSNRMGVTYALVFFFGSILGLLGQMSRFLTGLNPKPVSQGPVVIKKKDPKNQRMRDPRQRVKGPSLSVANHITEFG